MGRKQVKLRWRLIEVSGRSKHVVHMMWGTAELMWDKQGVDGTKAKNTLILVVFSNTNFMAFILSNLQSTSGIRGC